MANKQPDLELIQQILTGEQAAWAQLVTHYTPLLFALARQQVQDVQEAQDIVQEAFLQGYLHLAQLRDPARLTAWLCRIVMNLCHARQRRNKAQWVPLGTADDTGVIAHEYTLLHRRSASPILATEDGILQMETNALITQALATLPMPLRVTMMLFYLEGFSYQEIADQLTVPIGTVKRRLHDARHQLKKEISKMTSETVMLQAAVGLETIGQQHTPIFGKGLHLPAACTILFSTAQDNQDAITIHLLQGDALPMVECKSITHLLIKNIATGQPKQTPQLKVTFMIDATGKIHCRATELPTRALLVEGTPATVEVAYT